ncbi:hypothetical protein [Ammoniphilus sp. YIM 78166]|uniref:hypothetical protein n=1 Tax=Ammoniphilus sp. YIM 78166 TaxID=1644106 RepID=UPI00106F4CA3|nr:hypothetical protein [Ammoniphilus sp. YIM 78166]
MMIWKGEKIVTIKDFLTKGINRCECQEEAKTFMKLYRTENPRADENIDFMSCYYTTEEMLRIKNWFGIEKQSYASQALLA